MSKRENRLGQPVLETEPTQLSSELHSFIGSNSRLWFSIEESSEVPLWISIGNAGWIIWNTLILEDWGEVRRL
jgi:hypothetical protein